MPTYSHGTIIPEIREMLPFDEICRGEGVAWLRGYFGDDVDMCIDLIKQVDSPRMKLLFDVYHEQVMNGDVIRRIRQYKEYIGHYHVAGVPGRAELDDTQEINYPAVMRAILETGYTGLVSQEFIPTWPDKLAALRHAVRVCDV